MAPLGNSLKQLIWVLRIWVVQTEISKYCVSDAYLEKFQSLLIGLYILISRSTTSSQLCTADILLLLHENKQIKRYLSGRPLCMEDENVQQLLNISLRRAFVVHVRLSSLLFHCIRDVSEDTIFEANATGLRPRPNLFTDIRQLTTLLSNQHKLLFTASGISNTYIVIVSLPDL